MHRLVSWDKKEISELQKTFLKDEADTLIPALHDIGIVHSNESPPECTSQTCSKAKPMTLKPRKEMVNDKCNWVCGSCTGTRAIRTGTWLASFNRSLGIVLLIIVYWCIQLNHKKTELLTDMSDQLISSTFQKIRFLVSYYH